MSANKAIHYARRVLTFDKSVNGFIMIVHENILAMLLTEMLTEPAERGKKISKKCHRRPLFTDQSEVNALPAGCD